MRLHEDEAFFADLVVLTARELGMSEVHIEKDYWVTLILQRLASLDEKLKKRVVFKGGTSLSKAHRLIVHAGVLGHLRRSYVDS